MAPLIHQRCFHHATREASARCPQCGHHYCRECIAEHAGKLICAACLRRSMTTPSSSGRWFAGLGRAIQLAVGVFLAWIFFYQSGRLLLQLPSAFHEGTIWRTHWLEGG
jgi:hypothetical protein